MLQYLFEIYAVKYVCPGKTWNFYVCPVDISNTLMQGLASQPASQSFHIPVINGISVIYQTVSVDIKLLCTRSHASEVSNLRPGSRAHLRVLGDLGF